MTTRILASSVALKTPSDEPGPVDIKISTIFNGPHACPIRQSIESRIREMTRGLLLDTTISYQYT